MEIQDILVLKGLQVKRETVDILVLKEYKV